MAVNLSIKNVPDELAARLRARAARNHRSLQGELMAILENAVGSGPMVDADALLNKVRELELRTGDDATRMLRMDREER